MDWMTWMTTQDEGNEFFCEACDKKLPRYSPNRTTKSDGPGMGRRSGYCRECAKEVRLEEVQIEGIGD